jgi:fructose-1,6-bisphosphatase/inositol monophosphatase family enzyme
MEIAPSLGIGEVNGHTMGIVMKDLVIRATRIIRARRLTFVEKVKMGYSGEMDDKETDSDTLSQDVYCKLLQECFPRVGIIGEEGKLRIPPAPGVHAYFTIDPLDGTKAYTRKQPHGVATMIALVINGVVRAAYICNINSGQIIGYRPDSDKVHLIDVLDGMYEQLLPPYERPAVIYPLLRDPIDKYESEQARRYVAQHPNYKIEGSSIGVWFARLWNGESQALLLPPSKETPWDSTPVVGITEKLGYVFMKPDGQREWQPYSPKLVTEIEERTHDVLIVHKTMLDMPY